jgi:hypothetical protein
MAGKGDKRGNIDGEDAWIQLNSSLRFLLDRFAGPDQALPKVALTLVCPHFDDSPIIATLASFEEVTGRSAAESVGRNCRFLNQGCENDPETMAFMRKMSSSPEAAAQFRREYPKGKQFILQNARPARTSRMGSEDESLINFYNFLHIFGVEATLYRKKYPLLVGVQYVLTKPNDLEAAVVQTVAIQGVLEECQDLGAVFRQWISRALERFLEQSGTPRTVEGQHTAVFTEGRQRLPELPEEKRPPVPHSDLVRRIRTLMATIEQVERIAAAEKDKDELANDRLAQVQFDELVALRQEIYQSFHADLDQFVAWYTVPSAWRDFHKAKLG